MIKIVSAVLIFVLTVDVNYSQNLKKHNFPLGMFSVAGNPAKGAPQPGTPEFRAELKEILNGTGNYYEACNLVHTYSRFIDNIKFWHTYLNDLDSIKGLKTLRKVLNLGVDGIWFYAWRVGDVFDDDAVYRWTENEKYAEVVETQLHNVDYLNTAYSNRDRTINKVSINIVSGTMNINNSAHSAGSTEYTAKLISGDFTGDEGRDLTCNMKYKKCSGDGYDEIISVLKSNDGLENIVMISNKNKPDTVKLFLDLEGEITALTSGDFDGDEDAELVIGVVRHGVSQIYLSNDGNDLVLLYESNYWRVTAFTTGDFDGIGRDYLITAFFNAKDRQIAITKSDPAMNYGKFGIPGSGYIYGPFVNQDFYVAAMTAGDFYNDNSSRNDLVVLLHNTRNNEFILSASNIEGEKPFETENTILYSGMGFEITSITAGDFFDDNIKKDYLTVTFWNSEINKTTVSIADLESKDSKGTTLLSKGIYNNNLSGYYVTSMSAGNCKPSIIR